jgi:putative oxidoreductase
VHAPKGFCNHAGGYEYLLVLATAAVSLVFTGPGRFSVDGALGLGLAGTAWGIAALALGLAGGFVQLASRHREPTTATATTA